MRKEKPASGSRWAFEHQRELRALIAFEQLPPNCGSFLVKDDGSAPHLREGEYAVVDLLDREVQHGEIYLIQVGASRYIKQLRSDMLNITGPGAQPSLVWWQRDLRGFHQTNEVTHGGIPLFAGLSEGPYTTKNMQSALVGRVIGYALKPLGKLIAPKGGYDDRRAT